LKYSNKFLKTIFSGLIFITSIMIAIITIITAITPITPSMIPAISNAIPLEL